METKLPITHYEVTQSTMALIPHQKNTSNKLNTFVLEEHTDYLSDQSPTEIIDLACRYFGSSLQGRQIGTKEVCNLDKKLPITIDPSSGIYFFPTASPDSDYCYWIAHTHIKSVKTVDSKQTKVTFKNDKYILLPVSKGSLQNQIQRTAQLRFMLGQRLDF